MTSRKRPSTQPKAVPKGELKQPRPVWFVTLMAFVLPGSGQVFNGAPARGVIMQFGIVFAAFISYQLTTPEISPIGRMAGGLAVWVFSIVDANGIAKRRVHAWARIQAGQAGKPGNGVARSKDAAPGAQQDDCRQGPQEQRAEEQRECRRAPRGSVGRIRAVRCRQVAGPRRRVATDTGFARTAGRLTFRAAEQENTDGGDALHQTRLPLL